MRIGLGGVAGRWIGLVALSGLAACGGAEEHRGNRPTAVLAQKLAGIGDSIMQGVDASASGALGGDQPEYSFAQGTDAGVDSLYTRYLAASGLPGGVELESMSGAQMIQGGSRPNAAAQADRVCAQAQKPDRVILLLGGNDVCNASSAASLPAASDFQAALRAALDKLADPGCALPAGTQVHVLSVPRLDLLPSAAVAKGAPLCVLVAATICPMVAAAGVTPGDLGQVAARIEAYNAAIADEVAAQNVLRAGGGISFSTDWTGPTPNTSVGTLVFGAGDVSDIDCFHPSAEGQRKLACIAWESWEGSGDPSRCF
jgi:lysophospholipase L1-like esterase